MGDSILNLPAWAAVAALAHAALGAYVLLSGSGVLLRDRLLLVAGAGIAWSIVAAQPALGGLPAGLTAVGLLATLTLAYAWYALVHRLLRGPYGQSMPGIVRQGLRTFWLVVGIVALLAVLGRDALALPDGGTFEALVGLATALLALALAAQLARNAPVEGPATLRLLVAAAGTGAGFLALLLAVLALAGSVPELLLAVCFAGLALAPVLLLYAYRGRPQWSLVIFVSPEAKSYGSRLLGAVAVLLLVLALVPVVRLQGPAGAGRVAIGLALAIGLPLAFLLFSRRFNARLRVMVSKQLVPWRYDYRTEWLRLIETLVATGEPDTLPERGVKALAQLVGSPAGVLWLRSAEGGGYVSSATWNTRVWTDARVPADDPSIVFMREREWIIDTVELTRRPDLYGPLARPEWLAPYPQALLLVPLISNQALFGFVVLLQPGTGFRLTFEEIDLLRSSGRQVAAFIAQHEADQGLAQARQFEAFNRLTAFVMHDLKNLIAQQSLMVKNASRHKNNPAFFEDAIATIDNSVARMQKLLQQLQSGETSGLRQRVRLGAAVQDAIERCRGREPVPQAEGHAADAQVLIDRERLVQVLAHLIRNAQDACTAQGRVVVRVVPGADSAQVVIADNGCGMDEDFIRNRLFRPFDTTKGSKGMGIGAYQARTFILESGGSLRVTSTPGQGTEFTISLPAATPGTETPVPGPPRTVGYDDEPGRA